ncbi:MAG: fasciclin domain-containing protein [Patescibacteria group bacterium]|jgi:uncharacterized surface protein with fasciclin (FAS1) repeats|nr:fasciclin domain-containing protein [Patescibacteria group bacterium]
MENNKTAGVVVAILAVVLIVAGAIWFVNRDSDSNNESSQNTSEMSEQSTMPEQKDIVETASATPELSTLVAAVEAAGLVETLQGDGPFTVLAPTNDAFAKLPAGTLDTLLKPENKDQLTSILTYHVISGDITSDQLTNGQVVKTVQGQDLTVEITDGKVYFVDAKGGKAMVTTADVDTSNGTVHIIDSVLLPQ